MSMNASGGAIRAAACALVLVALTGAWARPARAASNFPDIPVWAMPGSWQDSSRVTPFRCVGSFGGPLAESLKVESRAVTVRFLRDRATEARPDFGGYRLYRMTNAPDSSQAQLIRRFSLNPGSELTWNFSRVTRASTLSILPGTGNGSFGARKDVASGVAPISIAGAKLHKVIINNVDVTPLDLVVANEFSKSVSTYLGTGLPQGVISTGAQPVPGSPSALATGFLDADTISDVVVTNRDLGLLTLLLSADLPDTSYATGISPSAVAVGDLNSDGKPDVVVANDGSATVSVFLTTTPGRFGPRTDLSVGLNPSSVAIADVSGDGLADLVVANRGSNTVSVILNLGGGLFGGRTDLASGNGPLSVAVRDVSGDARSDIAVTNGDDGTVSVLLGLGGGGFGAKTDFPTGLRPRSVAIADVSGDGKPDLSVANEGASTVSVLLGNGLGAFGTNADFPTGASPTSLLVGELTGDGIPDIAVVNHSYQLPYVCNSGVVNDSIVTFVDPDSNGQYRKVCRRRIPNTPDGRCDSPGDSIFILVAPPGPHDGFLTWYSVTIERRNTTDPDYEDLFIPDTLNAFARCTDPLDRKTCPNLNHKLRNVAQAIEPTGGPAANLERVLAVPNPYRGSEVWDHPGESEVHFINLPARAKIRIYTAAGDLVRELLHSDTVRDFERWDLKNASGRLVASGIYLYRIEAGSFHFQNRLVVIR